MGLRGRGLRPMLSPSGDTLACEQSSAGFIIEHAWWIKHPFQARWRPWRASPYGSGSRKQFRLWAAREPTLKSPNTSCQKWREKKPDTIRSEIIACTVNHHTRILYRAKEPGIANKPYDFLYQPKRGLGFVEWYEPDKHGIWGNKRGEDGKLYVTRFDDEKGVLAPALEQFPQNVPSPRKTTKREVLPCPASHGDRLARLIESLRSKLDLSEPLNPEEYAYQSLPLCILDAVFSINAKYESTRNVVERYCRHYRLRQVRRDTLCFPPVEEQEPISAFVEKISNLGPEKFAGMVLANRQRTSTKSGIMKSEAALRFAQVLKLHKVEHFQDVERIQGKEDFENAVKAIPGQRTGITVRYFYMLAGSDDFVKPDRMILGFLKDQLGERLSQDEAQRILSEASNALKAEYPHLTTKTLDHHIWMYQREKGRERIKKPTACRDSGR
jgi:hypothetical protein